MGLDICAPTTSEEEGGGAVTVLPNPGQAGGGAHEGPVVDDLPVPGITTMGADSLGVLRPSR